MKKILFVLLLSIEIFALANRGGGPLLSHLFLTGVTFLIICLFLVSKELRTRLNLQFDLTKTGYFLFFIFFCISLITSLTSGFGLDEFLLFMNAGILFLILSGMNFSEKDLDLFSIGIIAIAVMDTLIGYFIYTKFSFPRFAGTFLDLVQPYTAFGNDFANFILLILPISLYQFFKKHERATTQLVTGLATAVLLSGFVLSLSRGAWISAVTLFIIAILWLVLNIKRRDTLQQFATVKTIIMRTIGLIVVTILLINVLQYVRSYSFQTTSLLKKATFTADEGGASATERIDFWKGAFYIIKDHPLFGAGVESFKYLYPKYQPDFGTNWDHPHDLFLKIGVENGIFATVFFLAFLIGAGIFIIKFLRKNPFHITFFMALGALGALGHNLIDFNFIVANFILFIVFIAFAYSTENRLRQGQNDVFLRIISIMSLFALALCLHEGIYNIYFKKGRDVLAQKDYGTAITYLEKAQSLFFDRDLTNYLAVAYRKQYEKTNDKTWHEKEVFLLKKSLPTQDAAVYSRLGEIYTDEKDYGQASKFIAQSIKLDPQNRLKYYYQMIFLGKIQNIEIPLQLEQKAKALLEEYRLVLAQNRHNTVLTDNAKYAAKLYELFGMNKEKDEINGIWFNEYLKFVTKFGAVPEQFSL